MEANTSVHGPDDAETLRSSSNLARVYLLQGRVQEAWQVQDAAYQTSLARFGLEDDCTQGSIAGLASIANAQGDKEKARELQRRVLDHHVAKFGRDHPWTEECQEEMNKYSDQN